MKVLDERTVSIAQAVLSATDASFRSLAEIAGLDPARAFVDADLRGVDFGDDDLSGFDFSRADLRGAKLANVRGLTTAMIVGIQTDASTTLPVSFDLSGKDSNRPQFGADTPLQGRAHAPQGPSVRAEVRAGSRSKVVVVTSGKGGVGKTTSTAALGAGLAQLGKKVVVVDFDVGLRNLDLVMGAERRVVFDLINVIQGDAKLAQALIRDRRIENLSLLPASQTRDRDALSSEGVARVIAELRTQFDWVVCDSPAGIEKGAMLAMHHADAAVVVTDPEVSSVRDSDRIIGLLDSKTAKAEKGERIEKHLLVTRYDPIRAARGEMLKVEDVLEILSIPLLGIIPESEEVLRASNVGSPVTLSAPQSTPGRAYFDAAKRLNGETVTMSVPGEKRLPAIRTSGRSVA